MAHFMEGRPRQCSVQAGQGLHAGTSLQKEILGNCSSTDLAEFFNKRTKRQEDNERVSILILKVDPSMRGGS